MNFFFFLDHPSKDLESSIDLFNRPPSSTWSKKTIFDVYIHAFYSNGKNWIFKNIGLLKKNENININKNNLPNEFKDKSVFITFSKYQKLNILKNENYMESIPAWRSNIKIISKYTSCSYQGEIPGSLIEKKLSLVSCSPMIQFNNKFQNFFYLVNLNINPKKIKFKINLMNAKKEILYTHNFYTNTINVLNLNNININLNDQMYIFTSEERGGIPIYFTKDADNKALSLEHTHPPTEYTVHGDRIYFQKIKKSFWFN